VSANKSKLPPKRGAEDTVDESPELGDNISGRVKFDDRGNAVWEWSVATGAFGREVSTERLKRLENPALSIAEDAPTPFDIARPNPLGTVKGYDPYDSGKLGKAAAARKKDLRRLSEFLKLKKQFADNKDGEE
jgi:hypothetical protein